MNILHQYSYIDKIIRLTGIMSVIFMMVLIIWGWGLRGEKNIANLIPLDCQKKFMGKSIGNLWKALHVVTVVVNFFISNINLSVKNIKKIRYMSEQLCHCDQEEAFLYSFLISSTNDNSKICSYSCALKSMYLHWFKFLAGNFSPS